MAVPHHRPHHDPCHVWLLTWHLRGLHDPSSENLRGAGSSCMPSSVAIEQSLQTSPASFLLSCSGPLWRCRRPKETSSRSKRSPPMVRGWKCVSKEVFKRERPWKLLSYPFRCQRIRRIVLQLWISQVGVLRLSMLQESCEPTLCKSACRLGLFLFRRQHSFPSGIVSHDSGNLRIFTIRQSQVDCVISHQAITQQPYSCVAWSSTQRFKALSAQWWLQSLRCFQDLTETYCITYTVCVPKQYIGSFWEMVCRLCWGILALCFGRLSAALSARMEPRRGASPGCSKSC